MLLNCGVGEDSLESLGLRGVQGGVQPISTKGNHSLIFIGRTDSFKKTLMLGKIEGGDHRG